MAQLMSTPPWSMAPTSSCQVTMRAEGSVYMAAKAGSPRRESLPVGQDLRREDMGVYVHDHTGNISIRGSGVKHLTTYQRGFMLNTIALYLGMLDGRRVR